MRAADVVRDAARSIRTNKLRTALSILGIVIGVASVIALISVGTGAERRVTEQIASLGSNLININPAPQFSRGSRRNLGGSDQLDVSLAVELEAAAPAVKRVVPQHQTTAQIQYAQTDLRATVMGVTEAYPEMMNYALLAGRFVRRSDVDEGAPVIVLGSEAATTLFGETLPIGETVLVRVGSRQIPFRVVGVMAPKGQVMFTNFDNQVYVPISTLLQRVLGTTSVGGFVAEAISAEAAPEAVSQLQYFLTRRTGDPNRFRVTSQQSLLDALSTTIGTFTTLLAAIAGISLVVGGIGIMNIMLVSVTERTREIGLRKALGAKRKDLLAQFLAEAVALSLAGGLIGVMLGWLVGVVIERFGNLTAVMSPSAVVMSLGFSMAVGLIFGVYPAARAASLDPVVALRHE